MNEGNCTGLHPYGPCAAGEGCNAPPAGNLLAELDAARARVAELEAENARLRTVPRLVPLDEADDEYPDVSGAGVPYPPTKG